MTLKPDAMTVSKFTAREKRHCILLIMDFTRADVAITDDPGTKAFIRRNVAILKEIAADYLKQHRQKQHHDPEA
jgi:hypothetical protein